MLSIGTTRRAQRGMLREWRLHALSVFSLAVAFVCLGAALLVVTNLRAVEDRWAHAGRVSVYLKDSISTPDVEALKSALTATAGVKSVRYISSGQARQTSRRPEKNLAGLAQEAFLLPSRSSAARHGRRRAHRDGHQAREIAGCRRDRDLPGLDRSPGPPGARRCCRLGHSRPGGVRLGAGWQDPFAWRSSVGAPR